MKKEIVLSLSQSYQQNLLDAIQLAEQGMLSPSQQAYCFEEVDARSIFPLDKKVFWIYTLIIKIF